MGRTPETEADVKRLKILALMAVMALVAAACGGGTDDTTTTAAVEETTTTAAAETTTSAAAEETTTTAGGDGGDEDPLAQWGETTDVDPALVQYALGDVGEVPDIVAAAIARSDVELDDATIAIAMECWNNVECDTGTGGDVVMGVADGGRLNVWRQTSHMEAILQALTYPEIGKIISRDAQWNTDPSVADSDIRFLIQNDVDFIVGYPDHGTALADAVLAAEAAGIPYIPFSAGWIGLPGDDGALIPGEDYLTIVGEDLCALGESWADVMNEHVGEGRVGVMGGTPGNALSAGWQRCLIPAMNDGIELVGEPADTFWANDVALQVVLGWLSANPDIDGYAYEYADGLYTALDAYETLGIEIDDLTIAIRTDESRLFCDWVERNNPEYRIFRTAGGTFQTRIAVTAGMMHLAGADIPAEIVVPHVVREITTDDCNAELPPMVSNTALVPLEVLNEMYPG